MSVEKEVPKKDKTIGVRYNSKLKDQLESEGITIQDVVDKYFEKKFKVKFGYYNKTRIKKANSKKS